MTAFYTQSYGITTNQQNIIYRVMRMAMQVIDKKMHCDVRMIFLVYAGLFV